MEISRTDVATSEFGPVRTYFTTYDGRSGLSLVDRLPTGTVYGGESRPRNGAAAVYETDYATFSTLGPQIDSGFLLFSIPTADPDGHGLPDIAQLNRGASVTMTGSGASDDGTALLVTGNLNRAAGSPTGTYRMTVRTASGGTSITFTGTTRLVLLDGAIAYRRGAENSLTLTARFSLDANATYTATMPFTVVSADRIDVPEFVARSGTGAAITFRAGSLVRQGKAYRGNFQALDGNPATSWPDYLDYVWEITDANDADANGVPDLSDPALIPPVISTSPISQNAVEGGTVRFSVLATGAASYQWSKDGLPIAGATAATLTLAPVRLSDAGSYSAVVTNGGGSAASESAVLVVGPAGPSARLANLSVRTALAASQTLFVGVTVSGGPRDVLVRAVGPGLATFGLAGAMSDPRVDLYNGQTLVFSNDDWPATLAPTFVSAGAFGLLVGSKDAAFSRALSGGYSIQARGTGAGVLLVEAYDLGEGNASRLVNVSARNRVGSGDDILFAGFNIVGSGTKQLLIRAVGPGLAAFGLSGVLADPKVEIYGSGGVKLTENDNWAPGLADAFASVGAFALPAGSRDAALLVTLTPGSYSVQVKGADNGNGEALVEIYEVP